MMDSNTEPRSRRYAPVGSLNLGTEASKPDPEFLDVGFKASVPRFCTIGRVGMQSETFFCVTLFCPTTTIAPLGYSTSERNGLARNDVKKQALLVPSPGR